MLTERETDVLRLRDDEGLTWTAIAERLGTTKGGANSSYRQAKFKLARPADPKPRPVSPQAIEHTDPEKAAEAIDLASDPFKSIKAAAEQCGLPRTTLRQLMKRMESRYAPVDAEVRKAREEEIETLLEDRARRALEYADDLAMGGASFKDLMVGAAVAIDKVRLLKGQPTAIMGYEERQKLDELGQALKKEIERRAKTIDVTPRLAETSRG